MAWASSKALHMVSFEIFVKAMPPSLSELKVLPSFCFAFKIPDNVTASNVYIQPSNLSSALVGSLFFLLFDIPRIVPPNLTSPFLGLLNHKFLCLYYF